MVSGLNDCYYVAPVGRKDTVTLTDRRPGREKEKVD